MKFQINKFIRPFGFKISRLSKEPNMSFYHSLMLGALSMKGNLNIVQVGANDGKINDPIYDFVMKYKDKTKILLIEPQPEIMPYLKNNYSNHPKKFFYNGAVGTDDELKLYRIKEEYYQIYQPKYSKNWPSYRAPTGLTTSDYARLENSFLRNRSDTNVAPEDAIEEIIVPFKNLETIINVVNFDNEVDILQIDTEGSDDIIIYCSNIEHYNPKIINYESKHLTKENQSKLIQYLTSYNYEIFNNGDDTLAVKSPTSHNNAHDRLKDAELSTSGH